MHDSGSKLDCSACKASQSISETRAPRFGRFIRIIGLLILVLSLLGALLALMFFVSMIFVQIKHGDKATIDAMWNFIGGVFLGVPSLLGGVIGWFLRSKRNVMKCVRCGFILKRG